MPSRLYQLVRRGLRTAPVAALAGGVASAQAQTLTQTGGEGTSFFDPNIVGDPVLLQHIYWFLGQPEVYLVLLQTLLFAGAVLVGLLAGPWALRGLAAATLPPLLIAAYSGIVGARMLTEEPVPSAQIDGFALQIGLCAISLIWILAAIARRPMRNALGNSAALWLAAASLALTAAVVVSVLAIGSQNAGRAYHDAYYVVAEIGYAFGTASYFLLFAGAYALAPRILGAQAPFGGAAAHLSLTLLGEGLIFISARQFNTAGLPRRYSDQTDLPAFEMTAAINAVGSALTLAGWVCFIAVLIWTYQKGRAQRAAPHIA